MRSSASSIAATIPRASRRWKAASSRGAAPRASSKISRAGSRASRSQARSASAIPAGRPMAARPRTMPIRTPPKRSRWCTMASSRISPIDAVKTTLPRLRGAFALAFLFAGEDNLLVGARKGSPLAVGFGHGEMYVGSDAIALAPFTDQVSYLEDGDWVIVTRSDAEIHDSGGKVAQRAEIKSQASTLLIDKGNHRHFMAKEIHEQPEVVGHTLAN